MEKIEASSGKKNKKESVNFTDRTRDGRETK